MLSIFRSIGCWRGFLSHASIRATCAMNFHVGLLKFQLRQRRSEKQQQQQPPTTDNLSTIYTILWLQSSEAFTSHWHWHSTCRLLWIEYMHIGRCKHGECERWDANGEMKLSKLGSIRIPSVTIFVPRLCETMSMWSAQIRYHFSYFANSQWDLGTGNDAIENSATKPTDLWNEESTRNRLHSFAAAYSSNETNSNWFAYALVRRQMNDHFLACDSVVVYAIRCWIMWQRN